ncbi:MAG: efflux transporter outer membrane subunit [Pseudomonadota bacterium]
MTRVALAVLALLVAACAPYARKPDLPALTEPSLPDVPAAWQVAQANVGDVEIGWIAKLDDPVLVELVREALKNNRDLQAAFEAVEQSRAIARQARASLFPALNYSGSAAEGGRVADSSTDSYSTGLSLSWELDIWGRVRAARNAADYGAASAEADYVFTQYSLAASVAQTYFLVIESALQEDVARKSLNAFAETERIVRAQRELGAADAYDESLARSNLATARATLAETAGAKRLARRALEVLVGRYPADAFANRVDLPTVPPVPAAGVPSALLERRPDLIAAELSVASAFSNVGATKATRLPTFSLSGNLDIAAPDIGDALDPDNGTWSLATALLGPLFDAGLRRAQIDQASSEQRQAIASYAQTALNAFQEVENSLDQNTVVAVRVAALKDAADAQNRAFELAQLRYQEGETDLLDVLLVQSNTLTADSAFVTARREQLDEWINLNLALGGSWDTP